MQITTGIRSILSHPVIYSTFQKMMGAKKDWTLLVENHIKPEVDNLILDIGCGPADILEYMPKVEYWGFDISTAYIKKAQTKYGDRGVFQAKLLTHKDLTSMPEFDLVITCGVLHHLDDGTAKNVMNLAYTALKTGGRFVSIDPCYTPRQSWLARFLISKDRGQNVRDKSGYESIANSSFSNIKVTVRNKSWIPYTHCIMECTK